MDKGVCAITGANGFLGERLTQRMKADGWRVRGLRRPQEPERPPPTETAYFTLGERLHSACLAGVDVLIHCAYDFGATTWQEISETNIVGTRYVFEAAKDAHVARIVFVSSMHAFEGCQTMYGRAKRAQEECAFAHGAIVIRPGTICGEKDGRLVGGAGGRTLHLLETLVRLAPILPIPDSRQPSIYTSDIGDLCALIEEACSLESSLDVPVCAVNPRAYTLKEFVLRIKQRHHPAGKIALIPVPWRMLYMMMCGVERLRLKLPLRSEALALFFDQNPNPDFAPLDYFETTMRPF
jgi:nucleoside-diphosphate-sugar epimerase